MREILGLPGEVVPAHEEGCWPGVFDRDGMSGASSSTSTPSAGGDAREAVNFTQTISVRCDNPDALIAARSRSGTATRPTPTSWGTWAPTLLADRENPGQYLIVAEFGVVDPDVSAADEAMRNNDRPETQEWAGSFRELIDGEPVYHHYDEIYRTG